MPMRRSINFLMVLALCILPARGQSSSPASPNPDESWAKTVQTLAEVLVLHGDSQSLAEALPAGTQIRRFDRSESEDRLSLRTVSAGAVVIGALAYPSSPQSVASDLSRAFRDADFVPDSIRQQFLIENSASLKRADETAGQWVRSTLQPGVEQSVGVIVLWQEFAPESRSTQPRGTIVFVLVKGTPIAAGQFQVANVVYGETGQIVR